MWNGLSEAALLAALFPAKEKIVLELVLVGELELPEDLALKPKVLYLAFGESASPSQVSLAHGFEDD
jgi:hypothetical protein